MGTESEDVEVVRFYRTDKYPLMTGRLPDGTKILGGPYTIVQGMTGIVVILLVLFMWRTWAVFGLISNIMIAACVVAGSVYLAGLVRTKDRNPVLFAWGAMKALSAPRSGKLNTRLTVRKPHYVSGAILAPDQLREERRNWDVRSTVPLPATPAPDPAPITSTSGGTSPIPSPAAAGTSRAPVTAIERLMAQSIPRS